MSGQKGFKIKNGVLESYSGQDTQVVIPDGVVQIGRSPFGGRVFLGNSSFNVTDITIPNSVTIISHSAFSECVKLVNIFIPDSVTAIGQLAFANCLDLTVISLPASIHGINSNTFKGCTNLSEVVCHGDINGIYKDAFKDCSSLTQLIFHGTVTNVDKNAFGQMSENAEIIAPFTPIDTFPTKDTKRAAVNGFMHAPDLYTDPTIAETYRAYAISHKKK